MTSYSSSHLAPNLRRPATEGSRQVLLEHYLPLHQEDLSQNDIVVAFPGRGTLAHESSFPLEHSSVGRAHAKAAQGEGGTMKTITMFLILAGAISSALWGQDSVQQQIHQAFELNERGRFAETIELISRLTTATTLTEHELGQVWTSLAVAYHEEGRYREAATAYEHALHFIGKDSKYASEYGAALSAYAILYNEMGQTDTARKMQNQALRVYTEVNDHAGIGDACRTLANFALTQRRKKSARSYVRCAIEQSKLADGLNEDYLAALSTTEGWLDEFDKQYAAASSEYQKALNFWEQKHGEQNFLVGWGYMLLGKVSFEAGEVGDAMAEMSKGLSILQRAAGPESVKYLHAELAYAPVLDAVGAHPQAREMRTNATEALHRFYREQCINCSIGADALSIR